MNRASKAVPEIGGAVAALVEDEAFRFDLVLEFQRAELNQIRDIWRQKSAGKGYASRADFDARTVKPYMRNMTILDVEVQPNGTRRYRHRYMGSALVEIFGEQTGRYLDEFIPSDRLARWTAGHDLVVLSGRPTRIIVRYRSSQMNYLQSETLSIPLSQDGEVFDMEMSFLYFGPRQT
jgi:hypothetical protein